MNDNRKDGKGLDEWIDLFLWICEIEERLLQMPDGTERSQL
jgi:hypothetical protein